MIKRKFGMACLNISQGRYGGYSHKNLNAYDLAGMDSGIDRFRTFNKLEAIGIHELSKTGFANTVCFYDTENDVTLAMTHMNSIPSDCKVGKVYHSGDTIYFEGTKGNATGNHIHLEIGKGKQVGKVKINGTWQLRNLINIEDYFYIDKAYTEVRNDKGYAFSYGKNEVSKMLKDRYQLINWNGLDVHLYKGFETDDYYLDLGLASAKGKDPATALQTLDKIDYDVLIYAKVPCNYFQMRQGQADDYGTHYGVEQGFTNDFAPKQQGYVVVCVNKDDSVEITDASDYWKSAKEVKCAFTPFWVGLYNGTDADYYSTNFGDKRSLKNTQSALMRDKKGKWILAVFNTACTCWDVRKFAKEYGCDFLCCLDSGGSSQMVSEGTKKVYTGRAVPNALCLYRVDKTETPQNKPTEDVSELEKLKAENNNLKAELAMQREEFVKENDELRARLEAQKEEFNKLNDKHKAFLSDVENAINKYQ